MAEYESYKQKAISLQEKLVQVESDLAGKEALCAKRAHLENELNEVREENKQYQLKLYQVEEEKAECLQKAQELEMNLGRKSCYCEVGEARGSFKAVKYSKLERHEGSFKEVKYSMGIEAYSRV